MKFPVITADPPWLFETHSGKGKDRSPEKHYSVMDFKRLCGMPVREIAEKDCALLMWTTGPMMPDSIELGEKWGFEFSTIAFTWAKCTKKTAGKFVPSVQDDANWTIGNGYTTRANCEFVLYFRRGHPKRLSAGVRHLIVAPVSRHSEKPEKFFTSVERLFQGPYIELFARKHREGWVTLGNELSGNDIYKDITEVSAR